MASAATSGKTVYTTPSDTEILATRVFDAPRELVFDAHTKPEHLRKWMVGPEGFTMGACEVDLRPGGKLRVVWQKADESEFEINGVYKEVKRPGRVVYTEQWGEGWPETTHIYEFLEKDGMTTMKWTTQFPSKEDRDKATGAIDGMDPSYDRLDAYLASV